MDIPESYTNRDITSKIINSSLKELESHFQNIKCEHQYASKRGRPVTGYIFTFMPETRSSGADKNKAPAEKKHSCNKYKNGYLGFHQRTYDYDALEKELLNQPETGEREPDREAQQLDSELREQLKECRESRK